MPQRFVLNKNQISGRTQANQHHLMLKGTRNVKQNGHPVKNLRITYHVYQATPQSLSTEIVEQLIEFYKLT